MKEKHESIEEGLTNDEKRKIILGHFSKEAIFEWMLENEFMDGTEPQSALKGRVDEHIDELWDAVCTA